MTQGEGCVIQGEGCVIQGEGFMIQDLGFMIQDLGFMTCFSASAAPPCMCTALAMSAEG